MTAAVLLGTAPVRALTINLPVDVTCTWSDSTKTLNCSSTSQPPTPGGPTNCSLSASPSSLSAAGPVTLTASCQGTVTGYQWSASPSTAFNNGANTTGNSNTATISANTTFTVTASNDNGSAQAVRGVQVGTVAGGTTCPGFSKTLWVDWDWNSSLTRVDTYVTQNGLGTNGILVISFVPTEPANNVLSQITATQFPGAQQVNEKRIAVSTQPCDLNPSAPMLAAKGPTPLLSYAVGTAPLSNITGKPQGASLTPGVRYYLNIAERTGVTSSNPSGTPSCVPGIDFYPNCELRVTLTKPSGH